MSFIIREFPGTTIQSLRYRQSLESLAEILLDPERQCVFFLGAGASIDERADHDLPTGKELSGDMAKEIGLEWPQPIPLSTVAYYYQFFRGRKLLVSMLKRKIADANVLPSTTIRTLVDIIAQLEERNRKNGIYSSNIVITTNYDQQFETAYLEKLQRSPDVLIYQGAHSPHEEGIRLNRDARGALQVMPSNWLPKKPTVLFKMHGCISQPDGQGLVITEEDYINFLTNALSPMNGYKSIPTVITGRIAESTIIFVGYSLEDWNFRTIFKATVEAHAQPERNFAVQYWDITPPEEASQLMRREAAADFWGVKGVDILNSKADNFMQDLLETMSRVPA